jgi:uncharacterized protein
VSWVSSWDVTEDFAGDATSWLKITGAGDLQLTVHVQPGAKSTACSGIHGDALKIRLAAPPVDGKANQALMNWLAKTLDCPQSALELIRGQTSRRKIIRISAAPSALMRLIHHLATGQRD